MIIMEIRGDDGIDPTTGLHAAVAQLTDILVHSWYPLCPRSQAPEKLDPSACDLLPDALPPSPLPPCPTPAPEKMLQVK